jgi:branched-chain amino acid aminotransferase
VGLKVYINGELVEKEDAKISVFDHGLLYGDGVFEGIRIYHGKTFRLTAHIDRLWRSAKAIMLEIPMSREEMTDAVENTVRANSVDVSYIRLVVTRGVGTLGVCPAKCSDPSVIIIADHISLYPQEMYDNGLEVITAATVKNHPGAIDPRIKSLNYLNSILAKIEALNAGVIEAIVFNTSGYVTECTGDNIFTVERGVLKTPPLAAGILEGITRGVVMELAGEAGIPVSEENMTRYDLFNADECFLTGTAAEIIPVVTIDRRTVGAGKPGPVTLNLLKRFRELVKKEAAG